MALKQITRIIGESDIVGMKLEQGVGLKNIGIIHDRINVFNDMKKKMLLEFKIFCYVLFYIFS